MLDVEYKAINMLDVEHKNLRSVMTFSVRGVSREKKSFWKKRFWLSTYFWPGTTFCKQFSKVCSKKGIPLDSFSFFSLYNFKILLFMWSFFTSTGSILYELVLNPNNIVWEKSRRKKMAIRIFKRYYLKMFVCHRLSRCSVQAYYQKLINDKWW